MALHRKGSNQPLAVVRAKHGFSAGSVLVSETATAQIRSMDDDLNTYDLRRILANLSEKEIRALKDRFGVSLNGGQALDAVARNFIRTRSRIRQTEERALRNLDNQGDPDDAS